MASDSSEKGRIDPKELDAAVRPNRKRKLRNRPDPAPELQKWAKQAEARVLKRPYPPGVMMEPAGFDKEHHTAPHNDDSLWTLQLADAFGTRSRAVFVTFLHQLEGLCANRYWDDDARQWRLDEFEYSAALAIVNSVKPRNETEAALAAQMVAVHAMQMQLSARALKYDHDTRTAAVAGKLARTYIQQLEALQRMRRPNRTTKQVIKVSKELHQHVHYHRGGGESAEQPHDADARITAQCPSLPG